MMKTQIRRSITARSSNRGYALLTIIAIGLSAITFLMTLASTMNAVFHEEGRRRNVEQLRVASEAGIDWAISQLNQAAQAGTVATIDVVPPQTAKTTTLPAGYLLATMGSTSNAAAIANLAVNVTVKMVPPPSASSAWTTISHFSSIYDPQLDPANSVTTSWTHPATTNVTVDQWRILESTATTANATKTIRVILQPRHDPPPSPGSGPPGGSPQSYFSAPLFANQQLNISSGTLQGDPSNPFVLNNTGPPLNQPYYSYAFTAQSNQLASLSNGAKVLGNVQVTSAMSGSNPVANSDVANNTKIYGTLTANGLVNNLVATPGSTAQPGDTVLANADAAQSGNPGTPRSGFNSSQPLLSPAAVAQNQMLPAPTATQSTPSLPDLNSLPSNNLSPGSYQAASLDTSVLAQPITTGLAGGTPVKLFIQGENASTSAVNINASMLTNASSDPRNLQIWYQGQEQLNINLNGSSFTGVVYAPNATVNITNTGTFTGGIVASNIYATGSTLQIIPGLGDSNNTANGSAGLITSASPTLGPLLTGYRAVTWEELK